MPSPRAYVLNHSVVQGGTLQACASFDNGAAGDAEWRVLRVTGFPDIDTGAADPIGVEITIAPPPPPENPLTLAATPSPFNREEIGYGWPATDFAIPASAEPGLYAIQFRVPGQAWQSGGTANFVVRSATTRNILVIWPFATTCAYAGGPPGVHKNLYDSNQSGRLRRVSLDRPYDTFPFEDKRSRTVIAPFLLWDFLQGEGYTADLDAATSFDLEEDANLLDGVDLVILVGHDEYLSKTMVERLKAHVADGGNLAVFAANAVWWQVRFEGRTMVCYKNATEDPTTDETEVTANFASPPSVEENRLTGVSFRRGTAGKNEANPASLGVVGTEFMDDVQGTTLGPAAMLDYETDGASNAFNGTKWMATGADGSPLDLEVLARVDLHVDPARTPRGIPTLGWYTNIGRVFTAATTDWARHLTDANVATVTRNVVGALKDRVAHPAWTLPARTYPGGAWSTVGHARRGGRRDRRPLHRLPPLPERRRVEGTRARDARVGHRDDLRARPPEHDVPRPRSLCEGSLRRDDAALERDRAGLHTHRSPRRLRLLDLEDRPTTLGRRDRWGRQGDRRVLGSRRLRERAAPDDRGRAQRHPRREVVGRAG